MTRIALVSVLSISAVGLFAQSAPKPGPEHQRLSPFVGNWTLAGEMKAGPMGPGGKITGSDRLQWIADGFAVERRFDSKGAMGAMNGLEVIAYDAARKVYTYNAVDSTGAVGSGTATNKGDVWVFTGSGSMGGKTMHDRCTLTFGAGNATLKIACEASGDGKSFAPTFEGTATRTK